MITLICLICAASFLVGFVVCLRLQSLFARRKGLLYRIASFFHLVAQPPQFSEDDIASPAQKDTEALYRKGRARQAARGEKQSMAEAQVWYRKAAKQGHLRAQLELAAISSRGPIELRDLAEAAKWWTAAAEQGDPLAQYEIGLCFASGSGVKKSDREALRWWQKAAQQDEMYALDAIGDFYAGGRGVKQDYAEAIRWWTKAAELGNINAQEKLRTFRR